MNKWFHSFSSQSSSNLDSGYVYEAPIHIRSLPNCSSLRYVSKKVQTRTALFRHLGIPLSPILNYQSEGPTQNRNDIGMEMTSSLNQTKGPDSNKGMNLLHTVSIHKKRSISSCESEKFPYKDKRSSVNNTKRRSMKENCKYRVIFKNNLNSDTTVIINNTSAETKWKRNYSTKRSFKRCSRFSDLRNVGASSLYLPGNLIQLALNDGERINENSTAQDTFESKSFIKESFGQCVTDES